ncbi:MAG: thioesterase family protein [Dehalococcoidia bacterium]|nr:thioesterase family protein [Dehalococcoidia bacterium]
MTDAVFTRDGDSYVPTSHAKSPWSPDGLHGGPPAGLLAYAIARFVDDPEMQISRLTVDLFRMVPNTPLRTRVEAVRSGRRVMGVDAVLIADGVEVVRASALILRRSEAPVGGGVYPPPPGPEGYTSQLGIGRFPRPEPPPGVPLQRPFLPGFHASVETRWVSAPDEQPPTVWVRVPMAFIEGEETTPLTRAAVVSDFGNALSSLAGVGKDLSYINADINLNLIREPVGEWVCIQIDHRDEVAGVGVVESIWYDQRGRYGRVTQSRLANAR